MNCSAGCTPKLGRLHSFLAPYPGHGCSLSFVVTAAPLLPTLPLTRFHLCHLWPSLSPEFVVAPAPLLPMLKLAHFQCCRSPTGSGVLCQHCPMLLLAAAAPSPFPFVSCHCQRCRCPAAHNGKCCAAQVCKGPPKTQGCSPNAALAADMLPSLLHAAAAANTAAAAAATKSATADAAT